MATQREPFPRGWDMNEESYEVGYGRPPRSTRFRPGTSGNPGGRPKKRPTFRSELEAELAQETTTREGGVDVAVTKLRAIVKTLVSLAIGGDMRAIAALIALTARE